MRKDLKVIGDSPLYDNKDILSLDGFLNKSHYRFNSSNRPADVVRKKESLNGIELVRFKYFFKNKKYINYVFIPINQYVMEFVYDIDIQNNEVEITATEKIMDEILSTFKFIEN